MSYLVLARKYRPRNFSEMVGQEHVVQALTNALTQQRLHHAYLFTGTRGVGKTTVSRILAKSLNCVGPDGQGGITATPCGVCPACKEIDSGRFPDYTELDAASNRGVDEVQSLLEQAVYKPVQGRFKVFMIDEVHMLTNTAFNAMLKTLEEPPEYLKFVLATTDPQKVPVTVLSRCLQFNLRPMAPDTVLEHLTSVLGTESVPAEPQALKLLARAARGSMRDALSLTDQAIAFGSGQLQEATVRQMLGSVDRSYVFRLIGALAQGDGRTVVETVDSLRTNGVSASATLEDMCAVLQRMAVLQAVPQMADAADPSDPEAAEMAALAQQMPADETQLLYSISLHGRTELGLAPDEYAALTMALLRLLAFKPQGTADAATVEKKTLAKPVTQAEAARIQAPAPAQASAQAVTVVAAEPVPAAPAVPEVAPVVPAAAPVQPPASVAPVQAPAVAPAVQYTASPIAAPAPAGEPAARATPAAADVVQAPAPVAPPAAPKATAVQSHAAPQPAQQPAVSNEVPPWEDIPEVAVEESDSSDDADSAPPAWEGPMDGEPMDLPDDPLDAMEPVDAAPAPRSAPAVQDYAPAPAPLEVPTTPLGDVWHGVVTQLVQAEAVTALVRELALQSQLVAQEGDSWTLRVERTSLNQATAKERLRKALADAGHCQTLVVENGAAADTPAKRNTAAAQRHQKLAEAIVLNDPQVQTLMRAYGAKIVPGSIRPA
ncbi:DNA polymerase III subunit gamma/tau [Comamonas sp. CMM01]|uniref:DNA polymerase III subunit gamma/tau n=1 Tax=Comamonas sp. CMM01 TaxID=2769280 RepID=UPI0017824924|nr:DNA polymerase III subunit gamma/tau [Comamonas sp. CMM01]MBD9530071.1 DNA polymerase III subunit gamma/tau [Comamonas sp. CMM01]